MSEETAAESLDTLHHVALAVDEIPASVRWYRDAFRCRVIYQDETWALLRFANCDLALVVSRQHPPHVGVAATAERAEQYGELAPHRDGTRSVYVRDPSGNSVEFLVDERA